MQGSAPVNLALGGILPDGSPHRPNERQLSNKAIPASRWCNKNCRLRGEVQDNDGWSKFYFQKLLGCCLSLGTVPKLLGPHPALCLLSAHRDPDSPTPRSAVLPHNLPCLKLYLLKYCCFISQCVQVNQRTPKMKGIFLFDTKCRIFL